MRIPATRPIRLAAGLAALLALALPGRSAAAQSLGLEAGLAGVENYSSTTPSIGVSAFVPFTDRFKGVVAYSHWIGCDSGPCEEPRVGYGNHGINLLGLFRLLGSSHGIHASLGAGMGWYEKMRLQEGRSETYVQQALTFSTELRVPVAMNSAAYLRGDISFPENGNLPRWGFVRVGVDVGRF